MMVGVNCLLLAQAASSIVLHYRCCWLAAKVPTLRLQSYVLVLFKCCQCYFVFGISRILDNVLINEPHPRALDFPGAGKLLAAYHDGAKAPPIVWSWGVLKVFPGGMTFSKG